MSKLWSVFMLILCFYAGFILYREYQKVQYQLNKPLPEQFFTEITSMLNAQERYGKSLTDTKKNMTSSKFVANQSVNLEQQPKTSTQSLLSISLTNDLNTTTKKLSSNILSLIRENNSYSTQYITFADNNFTAISLVCYKLHEIFDKFIVKDLQNWYYDIKVSSKPEIKIFDLRQWTDKQKQEKVINFTLEALAYLRNVQSGRLFWFQSSMNLLRTNKTRNQPIDIYAYILMNDKSIMQDSIDSIQSFAQKNKFIIFQNSLIYKKPSTTNHIEPQKVDQNQTNIKQQKAQDQYTQFPSNSTILSKNISKNISEIQLAQTQIPNNHHNQPSENDIKNTLEIYVDKNKTSDQKQNATEKIVQQNKTQNISTKPQSIQNDQKNNTKYQKNTHQQNQNHAVNNKSKINTDKQKAINKKQDKIQGSKLENQKNKTNKTNENHPQKKKNSK